MLTLSAALRAKSNSELTTEPMLVAALFVDNCARDSLSTASRMIAAKDPASVADQHIAVLQESGDMVLASGVTVTIIPTVDSLPAAYFCNWRAVVSHNYYLKGGGGWGSADVIVDQPDTRAVIEAGKPILIPFIAQGNCIIDTLRIQLGNLNATTIQHPDKGVSSVNGTLRNLATTCFLQFVDMFSQQGQHIGNQKFVKLAANAPFKIYDFTGFAANLIKGRKYALEVSIAAIALSSLAREHRTLNCNYCVSLSVGGFVDTSNGVPSLWRLPITPYTQPNYQYIVFTAQKNGMLPPSSPLNPAILTILAYLPMGGRTNYQGSGVAYRSLDVCINKKPAPTSNGLLSFSDVVVAQTALSIDGFATNDAALYATAGLAGWVAFGRMTSGQTLPPYRYWRFRINLKSTPNKDETPRLSGLSISYMMPPILLSTHQQPVNFIALGNHYASIPVKALNKVSSSTAALEAKAKTIMVGKLTIELAPEPVVEQLFAHFLRGKRVVIHAGYADIPDTVLYYDGVIRDIAFQGGVYILTVQDPIELADISVPRLKWPQWQANTTYASGAHVTYLDKAYQSLNAFIASGGMGNNLNKRPDIYANIIQPNPPPSTPADIAYWASPSAPTYWQPAPSVWQDITYLPGVHLCDVAADLLQNQINLPDEKIDFASLNVVQAQYPLRTTSGRDLLQPTKAVDMLSEIAFLTESFWVMREGKLALIAEALPDAVPVESITPDDIVETLQYRRGEAELKNECLIFTGWQGGGAGNDRFLNAVAIADAQSIDNYGIAAVQEFQDFWNVPMSEVNAIASRFITRWKNGRRIVRIDCAMRLLRLECGDVVQLQSAQLPIGDIHQIKAIILQKDLNWSAQTIQLTLLEI